MSIEIFDDDIEQLRDDLSVEPWNVISNDDVRNSCLLPIRISYEFVDMGDTEYGFNQNFSEKDTFEYFDCMKYISGRTIDELLMDDGFRLRRHSALHKPLKSALDKLELGITEGQPIIFHFGLYTDKKQIASRESGVRSPRIYFMQGLYGVIYPLFFDPYHEITKQINILHCGTPAVTFTLPGFAEWRDWQKECERTLHRAKNTRENGRMQQGEDTIILCLLVEPSLFEKTELGDFKAINDPKTTLSELEKSAQERIYLKLVEEIERITSSCN